MTKGAVGVFRALGRPLCVWFRDTWTLGWDVICRGPQRYRNVGRI